MTSRQLPAQKMPPRNRYQRRQKVRNDSIGEVFLAEETTTRNAVAWLELHHHFRSVPSDTLDRLRDVATQAQTIQQPSVVSVIEFQLDQDDLGIVMMFVAGDTLRAWLTNRRSAGIDLPSAARIVAALADALQYILDKGVTLVHPAIDPDKIIIAQGVPGRTDLPVLVDLGFLDALVEWNKALDGRAQEDVYALGLLFFDLLNGFFPQEYAASRFRFTKQTQVEQAIDELFQKLSANGQERPTSGERDAQLATGVLALADVLRQALAIDPSQRFANPGEFASNLRRFTTPEESNLLTTTLNPAPSVAVLETGDRLVLRQPGDSPMAEKVTEFPLRNEVTTIGAGNSDILLKGIGSQRLILLRHDRVYGRYYTITDAANGDNAGRLPLVYLDDIPLPSDYAAVFAVGAVVRIAYHRLSLELDSSQQAAQLQRTAAHVEGLELTDTEFVIAPNELLAIPVMVRNTTSEVGRFGIVLHGAPDTWIINRVESRRLNAGEAEQLTVHIKLPTVSAISAGAYPLVVRTISRVLDAQVAAAPITVVVRPVDDVAVSLEPESLRAGRQGNVHILNRGNSTRVIQVMWQDRTDALVFEPAEAVVTAPPGEPVPLGFRTYVREPRWFGMERRHHISVLVAPQDGGLARTLTGEVLSRALLPGWLLPLVALAMLLMLLISTFLLQPEFAAHAVEIAGTPVLGQPVAAKNMKLTWTPINSCFYSVYKDGMAFKWLVWHWNDEQVSVEILDEAPGMYEVRLRGCLLLGEKSWQVAIASPPPTAPPPTPLPAITRFTVTPTDLLLGEQGDICFSWEVSGRAPDLRIVPNIGAVSPESGEKCLPIADVARSEGEVSYRLVATFGEQQVASPEVKVISRRAFCTQNTETPLYIREGPGTQYPPRGQLAKGAVVYPVARPFTPQEQTAPERWLQVLVSLDDPRPVWVALNYLSCPDLTSLPVANMIPPTPTPEPTLTPTPTPTATPVRTPMVSVSPEIVSEGDCTMLKWDIQGVDKVFLNGEGIVGVGEQVICDPPKGRHIFTWKIVQRDGSIVELTRTLLVNAAQP